jgi:hypothetical protein
MLVTQQDELAAARAQCVALERSVRETKARVTALDAQVAAQQDSASRAAAAAKALQAEKEVCNRS